MNATYIRFLVLMILRIVIDRFTFAQIILLHV